MVPCLRFCDFIPMILFFLLLVALPLPLPLPLPLLLLVAVAVAVTVPPALPLRLGFVAFQCSRLKRFVD